MDFRTLSLLALAIGPAIAIMALYMPAMYTTENPSAFC